MRDRHRITAALAGVALTVAACGGGQVGTDSRGDEAATRTAAPSSPAPGDALPTRQVEAFDGGSVALTDYVGVPLVVNFWASWCPPCIAEMPDLEAVHQLAGGQVTFVGINTQDTPEAAEDMVEQTGVTYDLVRDPEGQLFEAFGVFGMPSTFYVDADGTIVDRHTGLLTRDALIEDLREHLGVELEASG